MRLLHVVPTYLPATRYGGPIHSVHGLCAALARAGHEVEVYTTSVDGPTDSRVPHDRAVEIDGVRVRYFRSTRLRRLYWSPSMRTRLASTVSTFDLVHLHSIFLWPTSMAARLATRARVPYVLSPRGMLAPAPIRERSRAVKWAWLTLVEAETLGRAAGVHLTSERELREARELPFPLPRAFVVPNGVDAPIRDAAEGASTAARNAAASPYVLFLGRLSWIKGLDRLFDAVAGTPLRVLLCGPDDGGAQAELVARARRLGIEGQVRFFGPVTGDDKWALLSSARLLVLPSYSESFGNAVIEAMAVGRPAVVTDTVGTADIVRASGAGVVCTGDTAALRETLLRIWRDREAADRMGAAGAAYARQHLRWDAIARAMGERYREAARPAPGP
jgi:glycosyltransferase involved in cell wall biosynthesis